jgi:hypothetical protein
MLIIDFLRIDEIYDSAFSQLLSDETFLLTTVGSYFQKAEMGEKARHTFPTRSAQTMQVLTDAKKPLKLNALIKLPQTGKI